MKPENWVFEHYNEFAEKTGPVVRAALNGELKLPPQKQCSEAWLGYALFLQTTNAPLYELIGSADAINHLIPTPEEVAWAFLRLKKRGWLTVDGDSYGLTPEGRRAIKIITSQNEVERLDAWITNHPPRAMTIHEVAYSLWNSKVSAE